MADFERARKTKPVRRSPAQSVAHEQQVHPLLTLQSQVGNAQVARLIAERQPEEEEQAIQASRDVQRQTEEEEPIQASRDVQRQADEEEEAIQASRDVQRQADEEEEAIQASRDIQRMPEVGAEGGEISSETAGRIETKRGSGSALDEATRTTMESSFGTDFSDVRVHTDGESDSLNHAVGARAFTTGSDIFLSRDASTSDTNLMAHELTHVVQQRSMDVSGPARVTAADDAHEHEAESMAQAVTQRFQSPDQELE